MRFEEVRRRLEAHRRSSGGYQDLQRLFIRYGIECFLRRLATSNQKHAFVLKGAMVFALYLPDSHRNTKDADFLVFGPNEPREVARLFSEVCSIQVDDGIVFQIGGIRVVEAGKERGYPGFKVYVPVKFGETSTTLEFDVSFGEAITPGPLWRDFPTLVSLPSPRIRVYPLESVVSEKFEAVVRNGMGNTRMKDFYDLAVLASRVRFESAPLSEAVSRTFERRSTPLPEATPVGLTEAFYHDAQKRKGWDAFLKRHALPKSAHLDDCCKVISRFVMPIAIGLLKDQPLDGSWDGTHWVRDAS